MYTRQLAIKYSKNSEPNNCFALVGKATRDTNQIIAALRDIAKESEKQFYVLHLNKKHVLQFFQLVEMVSDMAINISEVFKAAILASSSAIICVLNNPSENPELTENDIEFSRRLTETGQLMRIEVLDYIMIGADSSVSVGSKDMQ